MAFEVKVTEGFEADPASSGWHDAVLAEVVDLGVEPNPFKKGQMRHQGILVFQVDEEYEGEGDLAGTRKEARVYVDADRGLGSSAKGTELRRFLAQWRGREFSAEELDRFSKKGIDLESMVNYPCRIMTTIELSKKGDKFAKPVEFAPAGDVKLKIENYTPFAERSEKGKGGGDGGHREEEPAEERRSLPWG